MLTFQLFFTASFFLRCHAPEVAQIAAGFGLKSKGFLGPALGVMTAGAAYVPLSPADSGERTRRLLAAYPEHRRKVHFLQVAARSREDSRDYQQLRRELDRIAGNINGSYSEFDWTPLRYITRALSRRTLAGFYRIARVGVVTPLRDGMNLVAKEFVAAQNATDPGVLVLSRFAGAAEELTEALIVNPFDPDEIAEAMHQALTMELDERRARHKALQEKVHRSTARMYCEVFLRHLMVNETRQSLTPVARMLAR